MAWHLTWPVSRLPRCFRVCRLALEDHFAGCEAKRHWRNTAGGEAHEPEFPIRDSRAHQPASGASYVFSIGWMPIGSLGQCRGYSSSPPWPAPVSAHECVIGLQKWLAYL